ncbi:MAG: NPCBM/NEW2 domain-containing protein, partial [Candidatus Marsarchaeota archaeon]|nr:NPCBM/NEW2 domain-containing protein [Candidatus Marsarchaeota archaeon]
MASSTQSSQPDITLELRSDALLLRHGERSLAVSLKCPRFSIGEQTVGGQLPASRKGDIASSHLVELTYAPVSLDGDARLEVKASLKWSPEERVLRKWASYRITGTSSSRLVKEVVLEEFDTGSGGIKLASEQPSIWPPQSYPILIDGFFTGIEFPISSTRIEGKRAILAHRPGIHTEPGRWYDTRTAVYGVASPSGEKKAFQKYILAHSPGASKRMFSWEPWVTMSIPYQESEHLDMLRTIKENLYRKHGVSIDSCVMTAGWSNPQSLWEIDANRFPEGFSRIKTAGERMKCRMGLWISPSSFYSFALDTGWAKENGYETSPLPSGSYRVACLAGRKYQSAFKARVLDMFSRYDMTYAYFDGYLSICPETDHGHEPGELSAEPIADGLIDVLNSMRAINPDAWLEATCFGGNASPWWLFYVNTVLGNYGDDYCWGRVPAPVYRESYTTARDYSNLQGCTYSLIPAALQEVFAGLYNHTTEPVVDDAVMGLMRGNMLYLLCTNPSVMSDYGWAGLAGIIKWGRRNVDIFRETQPLLPVSWQNGNCPRFSQDVPAPREPYGYAHWKGDRGMVSLRNPWITPQTYTLKLDESSGLSVKTSGLSIVSLYPENRVYGRGLKYGDTLSLPLAPYETLVLSIKRGQPLKGLPDAGIEHERWIKSSVTQSDVRRVEFTGIPETTGTDWTKLTGTATRSLQIELSGEVTLNAPEGELLILSEEKSQPVDPICTVKINGHEVKPVLSGPDLGYAGTVFNRPEQWLFLRYPLSAGRNRIRLEMLTRSESPRVSIWAWAWKKGDVNGSRHPNSLPQPEMLPLGSTQLLAPVDIAAESLTTSRIDAPVEKIDGVFLDTLGPGELSGGFLICKNVGGGVITIRGRTFLRGLGVAAPSKLTFNLDGKYRRFQSLVGADGILAGQDKSSMIFQVYVDGQKLC